MNIRPGGIQLEHIVAYVGDWLGLFVLSYWIVSCGGNSSFRHLIQRNLETEMTNLKCLSAGAGFCFLSWFANGIQLKKKWTCKNGKHPILNKSSCNQFQFEYLAKLIGKVIFLTKNRLEVVNTDQDVRENHIFLRDKGCYYC